MDTQNWIVMPSQVGTLVKRWQADRSLSPYLRIESKSQYTGESVVALTVTDTSLSSEEKRSIWICVPHAHEPAGTAACMSVLQQLLTGYDLSGRPCQRDYKRILRHVLITILPDANPGGRCWAPVLWWDGSRYSNEELWGWMRGVDVDTGEMWKRVARWSLRDTSPLRRGIVYEQVNEHEFVEPNRDAGSTLVRLFNKMNDRYSYDFFLDLHQTEFVDTDRNCLIFLPLASDNTVSETPSSLFTWAETILSGWAAKGAIARPVESPRPFPYLGDSRTVGWFQAAWNCVHPDTQRLTVEVQNNSKQTPPSHQLALAEEAIWQSLEWACNETRPPN